MFDIGFEEILLIIIVAIIVLGEDKLPTAIKEIANIIKSIKNTLYQTEEEIKNSLDIEDDLQKEIKKLKEDIKK